MRMRRAYVRIFEPEKCLMSGDLPAYMVYSLQHRSSPGSDITLTTAVLLGHACSPYMRWNLRLSRSVLLPSPISCCPCIVYQGVSPRDNDSSGLAVQVPCNRTVSNGVCNRVWPRCRASCKISLDHGVFHEGCKVCSAGHIHTTVRPRIKSTQL